MISNAVFRTWDILCLKSVKALLQLSHFLDVCLHQWALIILVNLPHHKLRISTNDQLLDSQFCCDPEPGKESFIFCSIVGSLLPGEMHLNHILEVLPRGSNEKHASSCSLWGEDTIKVHDPFLGRFLAGDSCLQHFFIRGRRPFCNKLRQCSA